MVVSNLNGKNNGNTSNRHMLIILQFKDSRQKDIHQTEPEASELGTEEAPRTQHVVLLRNQVQILLPKYLLLQF